MTLPVCHQESVTQVGQGTNLHSKPPAAVSCSFWEEGSVNWLVILIFCRCYSNFEELCIQEVAEPRLRQAELARLRRIG